MPNETKHEPKTVADVVRKMSKALEELSSGDDRKRALDALTVMYGPKA